MVEIIEKEVRDYSILSDQGKVERPKDEKESLLGISREVVPVKKEKPV